VSVSDPQPAKSTIGFARFISIIGHPFTFVALLLSLPFWRKGDLNGLRIAGLVAVIGFVPLGLFMRQRYRAGHWQTVDASAPKDRPVAFLAIFAVLLPFTIYFYVVEHSMVLVRGCLVFAGMMLVGALLNRWIKISGHLAFAAFATVIFARINIVAGLAAGLSLPVLAWSRVTLSRHTYPEVFAGFILGLVAGVVMLCLS
jgi:hypothetical protein